jgi:hypothetical protein
MSSTLERRQKWTRVIGVERRRAPFSYLNGRPLPDPTRLEDEDFERSAREREKDRRLAQKPLDNRRSR